MADSSAPVNSAAPANPLAAASTGPNAVPKNPFAEARSGKPSESAPSSVTQPLSVTPDVHKPADTPAATANGDAAAVEKNGTGVNGVGGKIEPLVPEENKQASAPAPEAAAEKPASSTLAAPSAEASADPPVMTGALPETSAPKPSESTQHDGVSDVPATAAAPQQAGLTQTDGIRDDPAISTLSTDAKPLSDTAPPAVNGEEKKSAGIEDAAPASLLTGAATSTDVAPGGVSAETPENKTESKDVEKNNVAPPVVSAATIPAATPAAAEDVEMKDATPATASELPAKPSTADTTSTPLAPASTLHAEKPAEPAPTPVTGAEDKAPAPLAGTSTTAAPASDTATSAGTSSATGGGIPASRKRKAEADSEEPAGADEPTAKKRKGPFAKAVAKAKGVVDDMKEKRKNKKKEPAPVGRTERKTRSQGRVD